MNDAWKTLIEAGLPDGAPRRPQACLNFEAVRRALFGLDLDALTDVERILVAAWLEALAHHFPSRFERELGSEGHRLRHSLRARVSDGNRYIKLRRIAVENLAAAL